MERGKHFALDTDWLTATSMVALFFVCLFFAAGNSWLLARGSFQVSSTPWSAIVFAASFFWAAYKLPEKTFKVAACMLAVGPVVKVVLWVFRATPETLRWNAAFERAFDIIVYLGGCVYVVNWFWNRFQRVDEPPHESVNNGPGKSLGE